MENYFSLLTLLCPGLECRIRRDGVLRPAVVPASLPVDIVDRVLNRVPQNASGGLTLCFSTTGTEVVCGLQAVFSGSENRYDRLVEEIRQLLDFTGIPSCRLECRPLPEGVDISLVVEHNPARYA